MSVILCLTLIKRIIIVFADTLASRKETHEGFFAREGEMLKEKSQLECIMI